MKSVCGVLDSIPISDQSEFMDDFIAIMSEYALRSGQHNDLNSKCGVTFELIVVYGEKTLKRNDPGHR